MGVKNIIAELVFSLDKWNLPEDKTNASASNVLAGVDLWLRILAELMTLDEVIGCF